ncbi:transposase [Amycolatopsis bartoniae]|nr:transposase [Amycolatopsis bartoniae]
MTTMTQSAMDDSGGGVVGGVDTHRDTHTAAVLDARGRLLGTAEFPATQDGYARVLAWLRGFGPLSRVGVEGTGAYGAGLARSLAGHGITVLEVARPDRRARRVRGKSDPFDAENAARAVLSQDGTRVSTPKDRAGATEALRAVRVARRSAVAARAIVLNQIHTLLVTAPEPLRSQLRGLAPARVIAVCAGEDPAQLTDPAHIGDPATATRLALYHLARRHHHLCGEITALDQVATALVERINPALLQLPGVGPDCAGQLLVTAGDNPDRLHSEAAFAHLCGVAPIPASSGHTHRHRLNRGGDRQANAALYRITLSRLRWDPRTRDYQQRRTHQGLTNKDIIRCLKRYIAREIYNTLTNPTTSTNTP